MLPSPNFQKKEFRTVHAVCFVESSAAKALTVSIISINDSFFMLTTNH